MLTTEKHSTYAPRKGVEALFLSAFDGVPHSGTRELRLSEEERDLLARRFPQAAFHPLEESEGKRWYEVTVAAE